MPDAFCAIAALPRIHLAPFNIGHIGHAEADGRAPVVRQRVATFARAAARSLARSSAGSAVPVSPFSRFYVLGPIGRPDVPNARHASFDGLVPF